MEKFAVVPDEVREAYQREMDAMITRLRTESPYMEAIEVWLGLRGNRNRTAAAEDGP